MKLVKLALIASLALLPSCSSTQQAPTAPAATPAPPAAPAPPPAPVYKGPLGNMKVPADNLVTPEKVELGKQLFFDTRLSKNGKMACQTCHMPEKGWTDGKPFSAKFDGHMNTRTSPTLYNVGYQRQWTWDGRAATLEDSVTAVWKDQMGGDPEQAAMTLNGIDGYKKEFEAAMGGPATGDSIAKAIATFVRTITSGDSPWDRHEANDKTAVSDEVVKGFEVFSHSNKANCTLCHLPPLFTDTLYHNVGIGSDKPMPDPGRGKILADDAQKDGKTDPDSEKYTGAFKTPTLRSIAETGPYFHDGSRKTLEQAVDFMAGGGLPNTHLDDKLRKRNINPTEKAALIAFLKSLSPEPKPFEKPKLP